MRYFGHSKRIQKLLAGCILSAWALGFSSSVLAANYVINSSTTWGDTTLVAGDTLHITSTGTLNLVNGIQGGDLTMTLGAGDFLRIDSGGILDLSATGLGGSGGILNIFDSGVGTSVIINGLIRSNGLGSGNGGRISINADTITVGNNATIQALAGATGLGGSINLNQTTGILSIGTNATINTSGGTNATSNLITLQGDGVAMDGQLIANGLGTADGGHITMISDNGRIRILSNGDATAIAAGTGDGGTFEVRGARGTANFVWDNCTGSCNDTGEMFQTHNNVVINVAGASANDGVLRIGRSTAGTTNLNFNKYTGQEDTFQGVGDVYVGDDGGNSTATTITRYDHNTEFNGSNPNILLYSTSGNLNAVTANDFDSVSAFTNTGRINITDQNDVTVTSLGTTATTQRARIVGLNNGTVTLENVNFPTAQVQVRTDGDIVANTNIVDASFFRFFGETGGSSKANSVTFQSTGDALINRIQADDVDLRSGGNLTMQDAEITNTAIIQTAGNFTGNTTNNNYGTSTSITAVNAGVRDSAGTFVLDGLNISGNLSVQSASGVGVDINNADVTGSTAIALSGGGADITGTTGNIFRGTSNLNTGGTGTADINLTADFQGQATLFGGTINAVDTGGNFSAFVTNSGTDVTLSNTAGGNLSATVQQLNSTSGGRLEATTAGDINLTGFGLVTTNDTLVANSTSGGNITVSNMTLNGGLGVSGTSGAATGATAGVDVGTAGGDIAFNNMTITGDVNVNSTGGITIGTSGSETDVTGNVTFNTAFTKDITGEGSFAGTVAGSGGRVGFTVSSGDFTSGGVTATGSTGWHGLSDETLIVETTNGDILGNGYTTSGAGNLRLQAGNSGSVLATNNIDVGGISANQDAVFIATGDASGAGSGTAINVTSGSVGGNITATSVNASNYYDWTNGDVDITLDSGNLRTLWVRALGNVDLAATGGSILQDESTWSTWNQKKTIRATGDVNLTATGSANSYVNTGVVNHYGSNVTIEASGSNGGTSAQLYGHVSGDLTVQNVGGGNMVGDVYLGTSVGDAQDLTDVYTVVDVLGTTDVSTAGNVRLYGSFGGAVDVTANNVVGTVDRGNLTINQINATATSGLGVNLTAVRGSIQGSNITTAGAAYAALQAGSEFPRDKYSNVNVTGVNVGGDLIVTVSGSDTGNTSGSSVSVTGSVGGTSSASHITDDAHLGTVSMP